jgi:TDG/mug DNA glycosylase family protein
MTAARPTREQVAAARGRPVPDLIGPGLRVLFCGINPSLYSAAVGHHFARPGNRFWPTLHAAGFSGRRLAPHEQRELLAGGYGITNLAGGATAAADELTAGELVRGARRLRRKVGLWRPKWVAFLGVTAYRTAFRRPRAELGRQPEPLGPAGVWVLPNPSGLNAHYQLADLARLFRALRLAAADDAAKANRPGRPSRWPDLHASGGAGTIPG